MSEPDDRYLHDRSGAPDPEVERLERLLRPLGTTDDAVVPPMGRVAPLGSTRVLRWTFGGLAVAAAVLVALIVAEQPPLGPGRSVTGPAIGCGPEDMASRPTWPQVRAVGEQHSLAAGAWVETDDASRELTIGDTLGRVTLGARSRLQVRTVADDMTRLYLARGSLEAFVSADARPRFFQVDTDAARCVDLGCHYTLDVADDGVATVRVTTGQVAFETDTREVYIPAGANCVARPGSGPGTPRFDDAGDALQKAFDAYDTSQPDRRAELARAALATVQNVRDTLPAWHLLQDGDAAIVREATARLEAVAGTVQAPAGSDPASLRAEWKAHLEPGW